MATNSGVSDPNLIQGWTVQLPSSNTNAYGDAPPGYAQAGVAPAASVTTGQVGSGNEFSSDGISGNGNGAKAPALENPGYADGQNTMLGLITGPTLVAATRLNSPSGLAASVTLTGTTGNVYVGQYGVGGSGTTNLTLVGAAAGTYTVPPAGVLYVTTVAGVTATWITQN